MLALVYFGLFGLSYLIGGPLGIALALVAVLIGMIGLVKGNRR